MQTLVESNCLRVWFLMDGWSLDPKGRMDVCTHFYGDTN